MHLFLDCDGVLADFDTYFNSIFGIDPTKAEAIDRKGFWRDLESHHDFYFKLALMPDAKKLYKAVKHLKPTILTGRPASGVWAVEQKQRWAKKHFPGVKIIVCLSKDKCHHMIALGDVLVDDRLKYANHWLDAGGVFVLHQNAEQTLKELRKMGVL